MNTPSKPALLLTLASTLLFIILTSTACGDEQGEPTPMPLPSPTPGTLPATATPTIVQSELDGSVQVGFNIGIQDYPQAGKGVLRQVGRGVTIEIQVLPAPGAIQQVSIRQGRCHDLGAWVDTVEPAIGGVSESRLDEMHITDLADGNHIIAVSIPGGTFSQIATCGELPDLSHLEIPDTASEIGTTSRAN